MPWEVISEDPNDLDDAIADFQSTVTSIDDYAVTQSGRNRITAVLRYTI